MYIYTHIAIISIIDGDFTAGSSRPIKLIELSSFCHNHTKKHNFHVIKTKIQQQYVGLIVKTWHITMFVLQLLRHFRFPIYVYILKHEDNHFFCRKYSKDCSQKVCKDVRQTIPVFVMSAFVLGPG